MAQKFDDKDSEKIKLEMLEKLKFETLKQFDEEVLQPIKEGRAAESGSSMVMWIINSIIQNVQIKIKNVEIVYIYHVMLRKFKNMIKLLGFRERISEIRVNL